MLTMDPGSVGVANTILGWIKAPFKSVLARLRGDEDRRQQLVAYQPT